jgi:hypothetical protein
MAFDMSLNYAVEKFSDAVGRMAVSRDSLQARLLDAYAHTFIAITPDDVPEDLRGDFESLERDLTKREASAGEGTAAATINAMSDAEARRVIDRIIAMYEDLARRLGTEE